VNNDDLRTDDSVQAVTTTLDALRDLVEGARSMPMSASCVVNRGEVLALVDEAADALPGALASAQALLGDREGVVEEGRQEAEALVASAREERARLLAQSEVVAHARAEADRLLADAREQAAAMRLEVEDYVDGKLATFEVVLSKTLEAVERGRDKLSGRNELEALSEDEVFGGSGLPA
jgi:cell division septum initiation protein DivIVA